MHEHMLDQVSMVPQGEAHLVRGRDGCSDQTNALFEGS